MTFVWTLLVGLSFAQEDASAQEPPPEFPCDQGYSPCIEQGPMPPPAPLLCDPGLMDCEVDIEAAGDLQQVKRSPAELLELLRERLPEAAERAEEARYEIADTGVEPLPASAEEEAPEEDVRENPPLDSLDINGLN